MTARWCAFICACVCVHPTCADLIAPADHILRWATSWEGEGAAPYSYLDPLDLACLGTVVMLAFHFAGSVGRRPSIEEQATWAHLQRELQLLDASFELRHEKQELIDLGAEQVERHVRPKKGIDYYEKVSRLQLGIEEDEGSRKPSTLVKSVQADPASLRLHFLQYRGWRSKHVKKLVRKLTELAEDSHDINSSTIMGTAFHRFDHNGDGTIDHNELKGVMQNLDRNLWTRQRLSCLFASMDIDDNGRIDCNEFIRFIFQRGEKTPMSSFEAASYMEEEKRQEEALRVEVERAKEKVEILWTRLKDARWNKEDSNQSNEENVDALRQQLDMARRSQEISEQSLAECRAHMANMEKMNIGSIAGVAHDAIARAAKQEPVKRKMFRLDEQAAEYVRLVEENQRRKAELRRMLIYTAH